MTGQGDVLSRLSEALQARRHAAEAGNAAALEALERLRAAAAALAEVSADEAADPAPDAVASSRDENAALRAAVEALSARSAALEAECGALRQQLAEAQARLAASAPGGGPPSGSGDAELGGGLQARLEAEGAAGHKKRMGQILVEQGLISAAQLEEVLAEQEAHPQRRFGSIAVEHGYTSEEMIARVLAAQLRLAYVRLDAAAAAASAVYVNARQARTYQCVPIAYADGELTLAMANPLDLIAIENIELASGCRVLPAVAAPSEIARVIEEVFSDSGGAGR